MENTQLSIYSNIQISQYQNNKDATSRISKSFSAFIDTLTQGDHVPVILKIRRIKNEGRLKGKSADEIKAEYSGLKASLSAVTVSGLFSHRAAVNLIKHSGLLCIDFDDFDTAEAAADMKKRLGADQYAFYTFFTASGNLAVIVKINPDQHAESYLSAERYYLQHYGLTADSKCKDVSRLRFLTYDPEYILNDGACLLPVTETVIDFRVQRVSAEAANTQHSKALSLDKSKADFLRMVDKIVIEKIDITTGYEEWLSISLAIAYNFPDDGLDIFHSISQFNQRYSYQEAEKQYQASERDIQNNPNRAVRYGLPTVFKIAAQYGIDLRVLGKNRFQPAIIETKEAPKHPEVLRKLLSSLMPVDFELEAFPQLEALRNEIRLLQACITGSDGSLKDSTPQVLFDTEKLKEATEKLKKLKLQEKHFIMLSVGNVIKAAELNKWGLCKNKLFIYLYNGEFWSIVEREILEKFLSEAARKMGVARFSAEHFEFAAKLYKQFAFAGYLPTPEPNPGEVLVNLKNGTYEVTNTVKIRPFDRADFLTYQLSFVYDKDATAPLFEAYLLKVLPDESSRLVLAEYLGYVFSDLKLEKALILYGTGANGKSVFFEIVNALLGKENITHSSLESLTNENGYSRATIANKLVNYASEINGKLETSIFKQLVSGEPLEARLPFGEPFTITKYAKLIFNCNELPKEVEHTTGYFRRFLIIPFNVTIAEADQDKELHKKIIAAELSGVFNWILDGLKRLIENKKFTECSAARLASSNYERDSDSVRVFLDERRYIKGTAKFPIHALYIEYVSFCTGGGGKSLSRMNFSKRLTAAGITVKKFSAGMIALMVVDTTPLEDDEVIADSTPLENGEGIFSEDSGPGQRMTESDGMTKVTAKINNENFSLLDGFVPEPALLW